MISSAPCSSPRRADLTGRHDNGVGQGRQSLRYVDHRERRRHRAEGGTGPRGNRQVTGVVTEHGEIEAEIVVLATGMWTATLPPRSG